jgi:hypothetical protein
MCLLIISEMKFINDCIGFLSISSPTSSLNLVVLFIIVSIIEVSVFNFVDSNLLFLEFKNTSSYQLFESI